MKFRPSYLLTLVLITLAALFLRLGVWQLDRKAEKEELFLRFEQAPSMDIGKAMARREEWARVEAPGHYDPVRHFLWDNKVWNGRAGVHVLTPFTLADGRTLLVNRGWLPLPPDRRSLPAISTDAGPRTIRGRLTAPPAGGVRLGHPDATIGDRWPQLVTYLDLTGLPAALGQPLEPWIVQLDADDDSGFGDRQWTPAVMGPDVHAAYAVQWLALCVASIVTWLALGVRRGHRMAAGHASENPAE